MYGLGIICYVISAFSIKHWGKSIKLSEESIYIVGIQT